MAMKKIKAEDIAEFRRLAQAMNQLMLKITAYNPAANLYIEDSNNMNLMKGPTHTEDRAMRPLHSNVVAHENVHNTGGGGW